MAIDLIPTNPSLLEDKNMGKFVFISYNVFHRNYIFMCSSSQKKKDKMNYRKCKANALA